MVRDVRTHYTDFLELNRSYLFHKIQLTREDLMEM